MYDKEFLQKLRREKVAWDKADGDSSKEHQSNFSTSSMPVQPLYTPLDVAQADYLRDTGLPGQHPFTRGIHSTMYRDRLWTTRQYTGFGTPALTNERFHYLLGNGQTGLSMALDLPTQLGYDSDDSRSMGEVGKVGVPIDSLHDMETVFAGIPLDRVTTSMTINAPAAVLLAMYAAVAEKQGVHLSSIGGTVQNDVLKEYVARGTYIFPPKASLRLAADVITYCAEEVPKWNPISISGYHLREAGCTAAQEIGFTLANAVAYMQAVLERKLPVDEFAPRISWIFNTHNNFFEEVAKYRALRRMWARIVKEDFGAQDPRSWMLRTHTQTGGSTLTAQQPDNNIVRASIQCLAAALGGVQSMALSCYDEALGLPTNEAQRMALRTQQIIADETGVTNVVDPLGGSYYVEWLTNELERQAQGYMDTVSKMGGPVAAIEHGYIQREVQEAAIAAQNAVETGQQVVVGVNRYVDEGHPSPSVFRPDPEAMNAQRQSLVHVRSNRDENAVTTSLADLHDVAQGHGNLMYPILAAVKNYATLGEICGVLVKVFGEYRPPTVI